MFRKHRRHYKTDKRQIPWNTDPYQSILNLNDDCFYELFTYLSLQDLSNIALTCCRLNEIATKAFRWFVNLNAEHFLTKKRNNLVSKRRMDIIIKQIAQHVKSFEISGSMIYSYESYGEENTGSKSEALIRLTLLHCHNITNLKIGFRINARFSQEIYLLENFQKLETLHIISDNYILKRLSRLKNLSLTSNIITSELLTLKNVDSLCLNFTEYIDRKLFSQICDNNPNIKRIQIKNMSVSIINLIVDKLVHLEDITIPRLIVNVMPNIMRISEIKSLKCFTGTGVVIHDTESPLLEKLAALDQLESLTYYKSVSFEAELITKFTKLKYLCVTKFRDSQLNSLKSQRTLEHVNLDNSYITDEGIVNFVEGAINLKYLSLCDCTYFDDRTLYALEDMIGRSNRKTKLTVKCDFIQRWQIKEYSLLNISWQRYQESCYDSRSDGFSYYLDYY